MGRLFGKMLCAAVLSATIVPSVRAELVTYTFDGPQFIAGQRTPLTDRAPNTGSASFLTSFTSSPTANGFLIAPGPPPFGQLLVDDVIPIDTLTLTFNTPVFAVQLSFLVNVSTAAPPGRLELTTPVGSTSQLSGIIPGLPIPVQGGTLAFNSGTAFTSLQLAGFGSATGTDRVLFAIDNVILSTTPGAIVPEPSSLILGGVGIVGLAGYLRRQRKGAIGKRTA